MPDWTESIGPNMMPANAANIALMANTAVNKKLILTYDELMRTSESKTPKWYTITMPGDGDDATRRKDVIRNFQTEH
jgi:hypothetical protein